MKKILCVFLALALSVLPMLALTVDAASGAKGVISDLLPEGDDSWLFGTSDCDLRFNEDGSLTIKVTGTYPSLWLDMAWDDLIFLGNDVDVNQPAYFALDLQTRGSIVLRQMIFHYTRKDKAAVGDVADLWLQSMYGSDYAAYRVQTDGMPYDPDAAMPNGTVRYVVWDWGKYLRESSSKKFANGMHHFTALELNLTGSAIGSELTIYTMGVVDDPDVELGQHELPPVEPGTEFSYEIEDGGAVLTAYNGYESEVIVPDELGGCPVTAIGYNAFGENFFIEKVQLPETVTVIDDYAFSWCFGLKEINFPEGLTTIGYGAFDSCALESLHLPASLREIGSYAFNYCGSTLESITVAAGNPVFEARDNCLIHKEDKALLLGCAAGTIPAGVISIQDNAFIGIESLQSIVIPDSVKVIDECAFAECTGLTGVTFPKGLVFIGIGAFEGCESLRSIVIPDSVTDILSGAFAGCTELTKVTLSKNLTVLGDYAFYWCKNLESIDLPDGLTEVGSFVFGDCFKLSSVTLPKNLKHVRYAAFANSGLTAIDLPEGLETIENEAFIGTSLQRVVIPEGVKSIGDFAFYSCWDLKEAVIPASVTSMGGYVFGWDRDLTDVYCGAEKKPAGWSADWLGDYQTATVHWGYKAAPALTLGDLNGNGKIDSNDYLLLKRYYLGSIGLTDEQLAVADVTGDGKINGADYMLIKRHVLGTYTIE